MKRIIYSFTLSFSMMSYAHSDDSLSIGIQNTPLIHSAVKSEAVVNETKFSKQELVEPEPLFQLENTEQYELDEDQQSTHWATQEDVQRNLAIEHDRKESDYSLLTNKFYENDRIRIFNYTAYNVQQLRNSLLNPTVLNTSVNEFYISFGYGIEFKINRSNTFGYEYLSSFPYDRGQIIRIYWNRLLRY